MKPCSDKEWANYSLQAKYGLLSVLLNKVLLEHSHSQLYTLACGSFLPRNSSWLVMTEKSWQELYSTQNQKKLCNLALHRKICWPPPLDPRSHCASWVSLIDASSVQDHKLDIILGVLQTSGAKTIPKQYHSNSQNSYHQSLLGIKAWKVLFKILSRENSNFSVSF